MLVGAVWPCSWLAELGWRIRIPAAANIRYARRLSKLVLQTFLPRQYKTFEPPEPASRATKGLVPRSCCCGRQFDPQSLAHSLDGVEPRMCLGPERLV